VRTPLLYAAGLPLLDAFGINLLVIPFSSVMAAVSHRKNIDFKAARSVIAGGILGTLAGAFLSGVIPTPALAVIFLIVSVITVIGIYFDRIFPRIAAGLKPGAGAIAGGAFILNFLTILRGGSGGSLFPPFLRSMGLDVRKAVATSLFATVFTASAGAVVFWARGNVPPFSAVAVIAGSIGGARAGSLLSLKAKPAWLEAGLALLIVFMALIVFFKSI